MTSTTQAQAKHAIADREATKATYSLCLIAAAEAAHHGRHTEPSGMPCDVPRIGCLDCGPST